MNGRIHSALDGESAREGLTAGEIAEVAAYEAVIASALAVLRQERTCDVGPAVMRRIGEAAGRSPARGDSVVGGVRRALEWLWTPRPVALRLRPAFGLAAAAAVALVVSTAAPFDGAGWAPLSSAPPAPTVFVQFRLDAPEASRVVLAGDFTGWRPEHALYQAAPGVWSVVVPLEPGIHEYAFIVDGERWVPDPLAPPVDDGFGGTNSRLAVLTPERRRS